MSHASVKRYAEELYAHFGVRTRHALVAHAFRMGLITADERGDMDSGLLSLAFLYDETSSSPAGRT